MSEEKDLFECLEKLPKDIQEIILRHSDCEGDFEESEYLRMELENNGYTCDLGLDCVPFNLRKIS